MKRGRLPLTALRSFEVAGRLKSFTLAADELFISQAAVSRQVRELEASIGKPLFTRRHRGVDLTLAGETLLSVLTGSFDAMGDCLDGLRDDAASTTVAISAEPSFAACWLVPNLPAFQTENPEIDISLDANPRLIEFRHHEASIAIRHSISATSWPRVESRHLTDVTLTPVLSAELLARGRPLESPADLMGYDFLHEENRDLWHQWFLKVGVSARPERGLVYTDGGMVLQAALRGQGVALVDTLFARDDIAAGRLIQPFDIPLPYGAYWMVARSFSALSSPAKDFGDWLMNALSLERRS